MTGRRGLGLLIASAVAAAALIGVGRWEQQRAVDHEVAGMRAVLFAIGGAPDMNTISGFRYGPPACLSYFTRQLRFGLQLCFSPDGHLVTAVDRRGPNPVYYSLEYKPSLSPIVYPPTIIDELLRKAQAKSR